MKRIVLLYISKVFFSRFENNIKKTLKLMPKLIFSKYENFKG